MANLWTRLWTKKTAWSATFCLQRRRERETYAPGSSAAHRAADCSERRSRRRRCGRCDRTPGPQAGRAREFGRVRRHPSPRRRAWTCPRIEKASLVSLHRLGTGCGGCRETPKGVGPAMEGTSGAAERVLLRGRAREATLSCAGTRQRTPGGSSARKRRACRACSCRGHQSWLRRHRRSERKVVTSKQQEVSESIGLG